jgi:hypothetical protein
MENENINFGNLSVREHFVNLTKPNCKISFWGKSKKSNHIKLKDSTFKKQ